MTIRGTIASITASILFGLIFFFGALFPTVSPEEIFGWRLMLSFPIITIVVWVSKGFADARPLWAQIQKHPWVIVLLLISAANIGTQQWLFMYAVVNDVALDVSIGYFLLPLVLVVVGRFIYQDQLTRWQVVASFIATAGVLYELIVTGVFSWVVALIIVGQTAYFIIRRELNNQGVFGLWLDFIFVMPLAVYFIFFTPEGSEVLRFPERYGLSVITLAIISGLAMVAYIIASKLLSLTLFGLLSYVEPALLAVVALIVGESIPAIQWPLHIAIWVAIGMLMIDGTIRLAKSRKEPPTVTEELRIITT